MKDQERQEKFTPRPWTMHEWGSSVTIRDGKTMVCRCTANATGKKYAKFLKTAPEMYAVLVGVLKILDVIGFEITIEGRDLQEVISNVLKKARGEA